MQGGAGSIVFRVKDNRSVKIGCGGVQLVKANVDKTEEVIGFGIIGVNGQGGAVALCCGEEVPAGYGNAGGGEEE